MPPSFLDFELRIENLTRNKLIEELLQISDISCQFKALNDRLDTFAAKHKKLITKNCNTLLYQRINQLEQNSANKAQYHRRESLEVNPVLQDIGDNVLEETVCRVILPNEHEVTPDDLHACYQLKNKDRIISKFRDKRLKRSVQIKKNVLQQKSLALAQLKFSDKLFISKSMCYENQQLAYKFCQLKNSKKIQLTWFWNNAVRIKVTPNENFTKCRTQVTQKTFRDWEFREFY